MYQTVVKRYPEAQSRIFGVLRNKRFELDIYLPSLSKAIEYDGLYWHQKPEIIVRDEEKDRQCKEIGISLLRIDDASYRKNPHKYTDIVWEFLKNH